MSKQTAEVSNVGQLSALLSISCKGNVLRLHQLQAHVPAFMQPFGQAQGTTTGEQ